MAGGLELAMLFFIVAFAVSALATLLLIRSPKMHAAHSADRAFTKPQKVHVMPVPRIGCVGIVMGLLAGVVAMWWVGGPEVPRSDPNT